MSLVGCTSLLVKAVVRISGGKACCPIVRVLTETCTIPLLRSMSQRASSRCSFAITAVLSVTETASRACWAALALMAFAQFFPSRGLTASSFVAVAPAALAPFFARLVVLVGLLDFLVGIWTYLQFRQFPC